MTKLDEHCLTIVLHTFNRLPYLKVALHSCLNQSNQNFDLLIIDNCSNDDTAKYLKQYIATTNPRVTIVRNSVNKELLESIYKNLAKTSANEWISILCDDDVLNTNFVQEFYLSRSLNPFASCIALSFTEIDEFGNFGKKIINPQGYFSPIDAFKLISNGSIRPAGVSGFIFKKDFYLDIFFPITKYPRGFLIDTLLFLVASINSGLDSISEICFYKRVWHSQTSIFSNENIYDYFCALLIYDNELRERLKKFGQSEILNQHRVMGCIQFFRIVQLPILMGGSLNLNRCIEYYKSAKTINKRYIIHAISMFVLLPISSISSLQFRKHLFKAILFFLKHQK